MSKPTRRVKQEAPNELPPGEWKWLPEERMVETAHPVNLRGDYEHICDLRTDLNCNVNNAVGVAIAALPQLINMLQRLAEKVRRANAIQHSGAEIQPEDWSELNQMENEAFGLLSKLKDSQTSPSAKKSPPKQKFMSQQQIEEWNARYPVGTPCILTEDDNQKTPTKTRSKAWALGHGQVLVAVEGKVGGWNIERLQMPDKKETK